MCKLPIIALILIVAMPLQAMESREIRYLQQGSDYLAKENYHKAAKAYEAAARLKPDSVEALLGMGITYLKLGDNGSSVNPEFLNQAESAFNRALEIDPSQVSARYHLGIACLAQDKSKEAGRQLELLKPLDQGVAKKLSERVAAYKPPEKYRQTRVLPEPV